MVDFMFQAEESPYFLREMRKLSVKILKKLPAPSPAVPQVDSTHRRTPLVTTIPLPVDITDNPFVLTPEITTHCLDSMEIFDDIDYRQVILPDAAEDTPESQGDSDGSSSSSTDNAGDTPRPPAGHCNWERLRKDNSDLLGVMKQLVEEQFIKRNQDHIKFLEDDADSPELSRAKRILALHCARTAHK
ncbi:hypothetical protein ADUPG1_003022 [Aduncisulcus paluster]|uniref:Uncharacterized protein n=1 Tax=Aduncisulcus paluster TaxID=2918883 RepID=A0ABQ5KUE6_9EUKA|nr:hypothetical protein ADUPG1_003022 [Aduncisulcus paluster]